MSVRATEYKHVSIEIPHLEFPVTVRLLPERHLYERLAFHRFVQSVDTVGSDVRIPQSARTLSPKIRLPIVGQGEQHDLRRPALHARVRVRGLFRKNACSIEAEIRGIPLGGV